MNEIFTWKILLNFVTGTTVICLSGFLVMFSDDAIETISFLSILVLFTSQVFFVCILGDRLIVAVSD